MSKQQTTSAGRLAVNIAAVLTLLFFGISCPGRPASVVDRILVTCQTGRLVITKEAIVLCDKDQRVRAILSLERNQSLGAWLYNLDDTTGLAIDGVIYGLQSNVTPADLVVGRQVERDSL